MVRPSFQHSSLLVVSVLAGALTGVLSCAEPSERAALAEQESAQRETIRGAASALACGDATGVPCTSGLFGAYFDNNDFTDMLVFRTDPNVDFAWYSGQPSRELGSDNFSIMWSGYLTPDEPGEYVFSVWSDDGVQVVLDGQEVVNDLVLGRGHAPRFVHGQPVTLEARPYRFFARSVEYGGWAVSRILVRRADTPTPDAELQAVPAEWLSQSGAGNGLRREIYENADAIRFGLPPTHVTTTNTLEWDLSDSLDHAPPGFVNRMSGHFFAPYPGEYTFRLVCESAATLSVDGVTTETVDRTAANEPIDETLTVTLAMGEEAGVHLEVYDASWNESSECGVRWTHALATGISDPDGFYALPDSRFEPAVLGRGTGLEGQYFDNQDFTNRLGVQDDATLDFDWAAAGPVLESGLVLGADYFSVRWTGSIQAPVTGNVTLQSDANENAALWIATSFAPRAGSASCGIDADCGWDSRCVDSACADPVYTRVLSGGGVQSTAVAMEAGEFYPVRVEYEEAEGNASMALGWSWAGAPISAVPTAQLYPPDRTLEDGQGLEAHYFDYRSNAAPTLEFDRLTSNAEFIRTDPEVDFNWGSASPSPEIGFPADNFMVRWMGQFRARYTETYTIRIYHDNGIRLWIDGELVIDRWSTNHYESTATVDLIAGKRHDIVLQMQEGGGGARARILWSSPSQLEEVIPQERLFLPPRLGAGTGLLGEYYGDEELSSTALRLIRIDPSVQFDYEDGPAAALSFPLHSVVWSGQFEPIFSETHTITVRANGGARLYLGGELVAESWVDEGDQLVDISADIEVNRERLYDVRVEYFQEQLAGEATLLWSSSSQVEAVIPTRQLYPSNPQERVAFGQCESVLGVDSFDDGSGLPDGLTEDEGLRLTSTAESRPDLWAANTSSRTVTRINTSTGQVIATYPAGYHASRTAVDLDYNAWVANRAFGREGTVSKLISVHSDGTPCVCCDGEVVGGVCDDYDSSSLCDECVAYTVDLGHNTLPRAMAVDAENNIWVGLYNTRELVQVRNCDVDPNSTPGAWTIDEECAEPRCGPGDDQCIRRAEAIGNDCSGDLPNDDCRGDLIMERYQLPGGWNPYGMAIDTEGFLWIADPQRIHCFDTETAELCGIYHNQWSRSYQAAGQAGCERPYGISIDGDGNIWWGEWTCGGLGYLNREVWEQAREDNTDQDVTLWANVQNVVNFHGTYRFQHPQDDRTRGVAVDGNGIVWLASSGTNRMLRFDPSLSPDQLRAEQHAACIETCETTRTRPNGSVIGATADISACTNYCGPLFPGRFTGSFPTCRNPIGVGISEDGDAWSVCSSDRRAQAFRDDGSIRFEADTGVAPYSYSDMTGFQLRNFTAPQGQWSRVFDCNTDGGRVDEYGRCVFDFLSWDANTPEGARVVIEVRAGDEGDDGEVDWGPWSAENEVTPAPLSGEAYQGRFVEVRVTLHASPRGESPVLYDLELWQCPRLVPPTDLAADNLSIISQGATPNYTISWAFTDDSWPERHFEMVDQAGNIRCTVVSSSSATLGERYAGNDPHPSCAEAGHTSNTPHTRRPRAVNRYEGEVLRSHLGPEFTAYTLVNDPVAQYDMRFVQRTAESITLNWCNPRQNWTAGLTGARVIRSTTPAFSRADLDYHVLSAFPTDASATIGERGYASGANLCGNVVDSGLSPGTMYYYQLTFQNGDGVDSVALVMSYETAGALCCADIGNCEGVCADASEDTELQCTLPPTFENDEAECDYLDNDCDGLVDEGLRNACNTCGTVPPELCDGVDNDCNGAIDDNPLDGNTYYADTDLDGFGDPDSTVVACSRPAGYVANDTDCDDRQATVYPGAEELCDMMDNDCDGEVDEGLGADYYPDVDGDGFGDLANRYFGCMPPHGHIETAGDCDDTRADVNPDAVELCDDIDNDCDGHVDEGFMELDVTIDSLQTVEDVGVAACDNDYSGAQCASASAVTVTVTNTGDSAVPDTARFALARDGVGGDELIDEQDLGVALDVGEDATRVYCFVNVFEVVAADARELVATVTPPAGPSCGPRVDTLENAELLLQDEVCDGVDNDCNEGVDELPEACGSPLYTCVENAGTTGDPYLCVITLETEAGQPHEGCEARGTCGESCQSDEHCGADAQCHQGQCVANVDIEAAIASGSTSTAPDVDDATASDATIDNGTAPDDGGADGALEPNNSVETGCSASVGASSAAGWAGWLFLLTCLRRRRCRAAA